MADQIAPAVEVYASIKKEDEGAYLTNYGTFSTNEKPQHTGPSFGAIVSGIVQCEEGHKYLRLVEESNGYTHARYVIQP